MLVFTRKVGESLVIGDSIEVKLLSVSGEQVRVGIQAPRDVPIHRSEIYRLIVQQNRMATLSSSPSLEALSEHLSGALSTTESNHGGD